MMILLALAGSAQNPNGVSYGMALEACARRAAHKFDDGASNPATIAHRSVTSCTSELASIRGALRTIVSNYMNPDSPQGQQAIAQHTGIIVTKAEAELSSEIQSLRSSGR